MKVAVFQIILLACAGIDRAQAITREETLNLPVTELAKRVLGETGGIVADVQRDAFGPNGLRFFTKPQYESDLGLCVTTSIPVGIGSDGQVESVSTSERYGADPDFPLAPIDRRKPISEVMVEVGRRTERCRSGVSPLTYFPAPNSRAAEAVLIMLLNAQDEIRKQKELSFHLECASCIGLNGEGARNLLIAFRIGHVKEISANNCRPGVDDIASAPGWKRSCYLIVLLNGHVPYSLHLVTEENEQVGVHHLVKIWGVYDGIIEPSSK